MKYLNALFIFGLFFMSPLSLTFAAIKTETVNYKIAGKDFEGFLAYDDAIQGKRPTVLIVHEWMGLSDYEKRRAQEVAALGYLAFAIDIYGKGVRAKNTDEAGKLASIYKKDRSEMRARAKGAYDFISKNPLFDAKRVSAMGFCFGGTTSLEMARAGFSLNGVVSFHGGLETSMPAQKGAVKAKILVLHGADDNYVPPKEVEGFEQEMKAAGVDWQLVKFGGAVHGFSKKEAGDNVASGYAYNASADHRSFEMMKTFMKEVFQN